MRVQLKLKQLSRLIQKQEYLYPYRSLEQSSPLGVVLDPLVICIECNQQMSKLGQIAFEVNPICMGFRISLQQFEQSFRKPSCPH